MSSVGLPASRHGKGDTDCYQFGPTPVRVNCPECGRFSSRGWDTGWFYTENGSQQIWGGTCSTHGEWSESAA